MTRPLRLTLALLLFLATPLGVVLLLRR